ncbi:MAG: heme exporter protein CcmD [Pseudomonadota bacterium]
MFGEHAAFIIPSYIITVVVLAAMTFKAIWEYKARKAELQKLEDEGYSRRSENG